MFSKTVFSTICIMLMLVSLGCSTNSFLPVHEYGVLSQSGTTLGQRTVSDPHAFSPGTQRSWLEVCQRKVTEGTVYGTNVDYVQPCEVSTLATNFVTFSPYVTGIATPIIQAGAIVGGAALLADGIRDSASRTTNSTTNTNGASNNNTNSNVANGGKGGQGGSGGGNNGHHNGHH